MRNKMVAVLAAATTVLASLTISMFAGGAARAATPGYVALGDSYAAGVGSGGRSLGCGRTDNAYPALWAQQHGVDDFDFAACGGATTGTVLDSQLDGLSTSTARVTVTVGGNDIGFARTMSACTISGGFLCDFAVASARIQILTSLPLALDRTYTAIRRQAPNADVVVLGYPRFYADSPDGTCYRIDRGDQASLNSTADLLDGVIATAAALHGFTYADVRDGFDGHELCDAGDPYLTAPSASALSSSYHPTEQGQQAYLAALDAA